MTDRVQKFHFCIPSTMFGGAMASIYHILRDFAAIAASVEPPLKNNPQHQFIPAQPLPTDEELTNQITLELLEGARVKRKGLFWRRRVIYPSASATEAILDKFCSVATRCLNDKQRSSVTTAELIWASTRAHVVSAQHTANNYSYYFHPEDRGIALVAKSILDITDWANECTPPRRKRVGIRESRSARQTQAERDFRIPESLKALIASSAEKMPTVIGLVEDLGEDVIAHRFGRSVQNVREYLENTLAAAQNAIAENDRKTRHTKRSDALAEHKLQDAPQVAPPSPQDATSPAHPPDDRSRSTDNGLPTVKEVVARVRKRGQQDAGEPKTGRTAPDTPRDVSVADPGLDIRSSPDRLS